MPILQHLPSTFSQVRSLLFPLREPIAGPAPESRWRKLPFRLPTNRTPQKERSCHRIVSGVLSAWGTNKVLVRNLLAPILALWSGPLFILSA